MLLPFSSYKSTFPSLNNTSAQVSLSSLILSKHSIAWIRPVSRCCFCRVDNTSAFLSDNFCLFPLFIASTPESTSGCMLQELAVSLASAWIEGSCTVRKRRHWRIHCRLWRGWQELMPRNNFLFKNNQPKEASMQHQPRQRLKVAGCAVDGAKIKVYNIGKGMAAIVTGAKDSNTHAANK